MHQQTQRCPSLTVQCSEAAGNPHCAQFSHSQEDSSFSKKASTMMDVVAMDELNQQLASLQVVDALISKRPQS
jgi:hypothetical protein